MERHLRPAWQPPGAFTEEALAAVRAVSAVHAQPLVLGFYPHFRTNPYQALLYQQAREEGIAPVGMRRAETIVELTELQRAGIDTVLHVHWLHLILRDAGSPREAARASAAFLELLDAHRAAGGRLVWTIHNILPHEARSEAAESALAGEVAARADVIHVLSAGTPDYVAPYFKVPRDRLLHVPHASYAGAYEDHLSRLTARHELELQPDDVVYLVIGAIRAYKGLEELIEAWQALEPDPRRRLVIAGAPTDDEGIGPLLERLAVLTDVLVDPRKIPAEEMQVFLRAADVVVLPYRRALNSGALMLALTFGLPVVVPAGGGLAEVVTPEFAATFEPGSTDRLRAALAESSRLVTPAARAAAATAAAGFTPAELSRRFARGLRERLASPSPGPRTRSPRTRAKSPG